jgi:hypothetical protein
MIIKARLRKREWDVRVKLGKMEQKAVFTFYITDIAEKRMLKNLAMQQPFQRILLPA